MSTSEPGGYVGDIFFDNPDNPTQGTHRWDGSQWTKLPSEQVALMELLVEARTRAEKLEEALRQIEIVADLERGDATDAHYAAMFTGIRETARDAIAKADGQ